MYSPKSFGVPALAAAAPNQENGAQNKQFFHCNTHIRGLISDIIVFENYLKTVNNTSIKFFMKRDRP